MIYTLYSYKGGVGRSMALANLGKCFFESGLKVVMIDWDLEAPGLERYFFSDETRLADVTSKRGLIDMLREYKEKFPGLARQRAVAAATSGSEEVSNSEPAAVETDPEVERQIQEVAEITRRFLENNARRVAVRLREPQFETTPISLGATFDDILDIGLRPVNDNLQVIERRPDSGLWILTAGARGREKFGNYADRVQDFDWLEFLAKFQGKEYLEWLRNRLSWADVVLIDSRTGVTEMGGVCTRQMGDAVVAFCAPNSQNVDGVAKIISTLETEAAKQARFDRQMQVLVIPTRIDDSESALAGKFAKDFDDKLEIGNLPPQLVPDRLEGLRKPLWNLQVPYIPKYNYREQLVIGAAPPGQPPDPPTQKLIRAYQNIAVHLAMLTKPGSRVWQAYASEIATRFPELVQRRPSPALLPVPGNWVERTDLEYQLRDALVKCSMSRTGGRVAVLGLPGMGKTSLVAHVCAESAIAEAFPDGILWQTLDGPLGSERVQDFLRSCFAISRQGGESTLAGALADRRFLWVTDDAWTAEQLDETFRWGNRCTRVIITRDRAIASRFADEIINVGCLTRDESRALLKISEDRLEILERDKSLAWLLNWPLGSSLIATAVKKYSDEATSPERGWDVLLDQLHKSGLKLLDRPGESGRNASLAAGLRESLGRLLPAERRLLIDIARRGAAQETTETPEIRRLMELGLVTSDGKTTRAHDLVYRWLLRTGDLTEDADARRKKERTESLQNGYAILRGRAASLKEIQEAAKSAKDARAFTLGRRLFWLARQSPELAALPQNKKEELQLKLLQQHALCTYKDDDLPPDQRFDEALDILSAGDLRSARPSQETLGLAGAAYKGKWRLTGQRRELERSLEYYRRGADGDLAGDFGYTRINAAFVLDLLARQEEAASPSTAQSRGEQAAQMRDEIAAELPGIAARQGNAWIKNESWYGATMAEALFGLKRYAESRHWLREAIALDPPAWQLETTCRQMAMLALAQDVDTGEDTEAWQTLSMLVGDSTEALRAITIGKVGLALSGGGFRASLFHIGVLARLAELDLLRHVEVLSCVSGGSIIGAHYYLEVRRLLQQKRAREVAREDYIDIVQRLERDFLAGVQRNLRARLFAGWVANWKSLLLRGYTRTQYLGELFERFIYSRVDDGEPEERRLNALTIKPMDAEHDFNPKLDNWRRGAKAPILLLNATTLNTGHVWQFAVNWMGEPPQSASASVDSNDLLRRMYYTEAPVKYQNVRLGYAVAASACVPALFDPIELNDLFPRRCLRLVDGGVHDNQGVAGLIEQECSVVIVSDASGQMNSERSPSGNIVPVLARSNSVSMARVREAEFRELHTLRRSSALASLMFLHLKKDLDMQHVDWIDCQDPYEAPRATTLTSYGMPKSVQTLLAGVRTDLDSFGDAEAYALMLSGYRMASTEIAEQFKSQTQGALAALAVAETARKVWSFQSIEPTVDRATDFEPEHERLREMLSIGGNLAFKAFRARPVAAWTRLVLLMLIPAGLAYVVVPLLRNLPAHKIGGVGVTELVALSLIGVLAIVGVVSLWQRKNFSIFVTGLIMVSIGWLVARIHLLLFDPLYRRAGAVRTRDNVHR
jgi:predicted acylesterase/phospholipase RssA/MinD-like ATPase involved in chromosome partitioning or flagellar assembly